MFTMARWMGCAAILTGGMLASCTGSFRGFVGDLHGNSFHLADERVETTCDAFVWKDRPPI
jgi:hypothetical protein